MTLASTALLRKSISRLPLSQEGLERFAKSYDAETQNLLQGTKTGAPLKASVTRHFFREYLHAALLSAKTANKFSAESLLAMKRQAPAIDPNKTAFDALADWVSTYEELKNLKMVSFDLEKPNMMIVTSKGNINKASKIEVDIYELESEPSENQHSDAKSRIEMLPLFFLNLSNALESDLKC